MYLCVAVAKLSIGAGLALLRTFAREARVLNLATAHTDTGRLSQLHEQGVVNIIALWAAKVKRRLREDKRHRHIAALTDPPTTS